MGMADRHRRDWEELAATDPLWAVLSDPAHRGGGWEGETDAFYGSGGRELAGLERLLREEDVPLTRRRALDFGCGVGRITQAMAAGFDTVVGMDHSPAMVDRARDATPDDGQVEYLVGDSPSLAPGRFDLVWSCLVIQHQPSPAAARRLIGELADTVAEGGVLHVQLPVVLGWRRRLQLRRRAYRVGRSLGLPSDTLYRRFGLNPIRMVAVAEPVVRRILADHGLEVVSIHRDHVGPGQIDARVTARRPGGDSAG